MTSKERAKHLTKADSIMNPEKSKINHLKDGKKRNQHGNFIPSNENQKERTRKRNRSKDRVDQHYYPKKSRTISPIRYIPRSNKKEDRVKVSKVNHHYHYNNHHHRPKITHIYRERIHIPIKQPIDTNSSNVKHNIMNQKHSGLKNRKKNESPIRETDKTSPPTSSSSISSSLSSSCQCSCNCYLNLDEGELEEGEIFCKQNDHTNKNYTSDSNCNNNEKSQTPKRNISIRHEGSLSSKVPSIKTTSERTHNHDSRRKPFRKKYSESLSNQNIYLKFGRNKITTHKGYGNEGNNHMNRNKSSTSQRQIGHANQRSTSQCSHFFSSKNSTRFQVRRDRHSSSSHSIHDEIRKSTFINSNKHSTNKSYKDEKFNKRSSESSEKRPKIIPLRSRNNICSTPAKSDGCKKSKLGEKNRAMNYNNNNNNDRLQKQSNRKRQWKVEQLNKMDKKEKRNSCSKLDVVLSRPRTSHKTKYNDSHSEKKSISKTTNRFELSRTIESKADGKLLPEKNKQQSSSSSSKNKTSSSSSKNMTSVVSISSSSSSSATLEKINHDSNHSNHKKPFSEKHETELQEIDYSKRVEESKPENITANTMTNTPTNFEKLNISMEALNNLKIMEKRPKLHYVSKSIQFQMLKEATTCRKFCGESLYQQLQKMIQTDSEPTSTIPLPVYHRDRISRPIYMKLPTSTNLDLQTYVPLQLSTKLKSQMHKLRLLSEALFYS